MRAAGLYTPHGWAGIARSWAGSWADYGLILRGSGLVNGLIMRWFGRGCAAGIGRVSRGKAQKNAKKM